MIYEPQQSRGNLVGNVDSFMRLYDRLKKNSQGTTPPAPTPDSKSFDVNTGAWSPYEYPATLPDIPAVQQVSAPSAASGQAIHNAFSGGGGGLGAALGTGAAMKGAEQLMGKKAAAGAAGAGAAGAGAEAAGAAGAGAAGLSW